MQLVLWHTKDRDTVRYLGVEVAHEIAEKIDVCRAAALCPPLEREGQWHG
jgi:hypothetical protein